jgi:hypothetical protein
MPGATSTSGMIVNSFVSGLNTFAVFGLFAFMVNCGGLLKWIFAVI